MANHDRDPQRRPANEASTDWLDQTEGKLGLGRTGQVAVDPELEGYHRPTALFDQGEFLGELAEVVGQAGETRARVGAQAPPEGFKLIVVAGPELGQSWAFKAGEIRIGRDESCELSFQDIAVSREHARIRFDGHAFLLEDLHSENGSFLNGQKVIEEALSPGDEITVGERTLRFIELNEAPSTLAKTPASASSPDPSLAPGLGGAASEVAAVSVPDASAQVASEPASEAAPNRGSEPLAKQVEAAPQASAAAKKASKAGLIAHFKRFRVAIALVAVLVGLGLAAWGVSRQLREKRLLERRKLAQVAMAQAIELVKARRFGDAQLYLAEVERYQPDHPRLVAYQIHTETELAYWDRLQAAHKLQEGGDPRGALYLLEGLPESSSWAPEQAALRREAKLQLERGLIARAEARLAKDDEAGTTALLGELKQLNPNAELSPKLVAFLNRGSRRRSPARAPAPRKARIPPLLVRAAGLYQKGRITEALDAARLVEGSEAEAYARKLNRQENLVKRVRLAHKRKEADELIRAAPKAIQLDSELSGQAKSRIGLELRAALADGYYLKSLDAMDDPKAAYGLIAAALKASPEHRLATRRMAQLEARAKSLYFEAYALAAQDPKAATDRFQELIRSTPAQSRFHAMAKTWLNTRK